MFNVLDITDYFILLTDNQDCEATISSLKLQKLSYLAYYHYKLKCNKSLFNDIIILANNRPIIPVIEYRYYEYGKLPVPSITYEQNIYPFDKSMSDFLHDIFYEYARYEPYKIQEIINSYI
jgi:uncharacterized phage-associated protein